MKSWGIAQADPILCDRMQVLSGLSTSRLDLVAGPAVRSQQRNPIIGTRLWAREIGWLPTRIKVKS
jgi:hypothetical protein